MYEPDKKIIDIIGRGKTTVSAEVIPPRNGAHQLTVLQQIDKLIASGAEFLSVTKGAGGSLRGGSLPIAQTIKEKFNRPCIAHFTCRDLTPEEVENQLIDHHYFGIRNILALRGDPPQGLTWEAKPGSYNYAYQLMQQIQKLNQGEFLERKGYKVDGRTQTDFCIGAAVYPDHPHPKERIEFIKIKVECGAQYGITQMVFSKDSMEQLMEQMYAGGCQIPILVGTRILKSRQQAQRMASRFEVAIDKGYLETLPDESEPFDQERVLDCFLQFAGSMGWLGFIYLCSLTRSWPPRGWRSCAP
jgi:methylenetetrahydrofolate reductase (NADPH)